MKRIFRLLLLLALLGGVVTILWVVLLPTVVASTIRSKTGFAVKVERLSVNPFTARVHLKGLVLGNPEGWPVAEFVDLREFRAEVSLFSLLGDRLEADEVTVDIARLTLVRNQQGILNAVAFKEGLTGPDTANAKADSRPARFLIRRFVMKFDQLVYIDHSGRSPSVKEYNLNLTREIRDVDSVTKIISPFSGAVLGLFTDAFRGLFKNQPDILQQLTGGLQDAGKKTGGLLKGLLDSLEKKKP